MAGKGKDKDFKGRGKGNVGKVKDAKEYKEDAKMGVATFFAGLPEGTLLPEEEEIRGHIIASIAAKGPTRLSILAQQEAVIKLKARLRMPKGSFAHWVTTRLSEDVAFVTESNEYGEPVVTLAGGEVGGADAPIDMFADFYATLPDGEFLDSEIELRHQILETLHRHGGRAKTATLTKDDNNKDLQAARSAVLPRGAPLLDWIERRMGAEVSILKDPCTGIKTLEIPGQWNSARASGGKGGSVGGNSNVGTSRSMPMKAAAKAKATEHKESAKDQLDREQAKLARDARVQEFLSTLPSDELTTEERSLRRALAKAFRNLSPRGTPVRFSLICQGDEVRKAKTALLPLEVTIGSWCSHRVGADIIVEPNNGESQVMLSNDFLDDDEDLLEAIDQKMPWEDTTTTFEDKIIDALESEAPTLLKGDDREARMVELFQGPMLPIEQELAAHLIDAVAAHGGRKYRLSDLLGNDTAVMATWRKAKAYWMSLHPPLEVSIARWIELRMQDDVLIQREPFVQFSKSRMEKHGLGKKRPPAAQDTGRATKSFRSDAWSGAKGGSGGGKGSWSGGAGASGGVVSGSSVVGGRTATPFGGNLPWIASSLPGGPSSSRPSSAPASRAGTLL